MIADDQRERMIKLLIDASNEAGESEGVWFLGHHEAIELCELLMIYDPSEENIKKRKQEIGWLLKLIENK